MEVSGEGSAVGGTGRVDVVVPLKRLEGAKSRLRAASAAYGAEHRGLVLALARDTLAAVRASTRVRRIVLVSGEPELEGAELGGPGVTTLADPGGGLNAALRAGAAHLGMTAPPHGRPVAVAVLQADLPALHPDELDEAVAAALARLAVDAPGGPAPAAFVADRQGTGTTLLVTAAGAEPRPRFGPGSAGAHRAQGAVALDGAWPGLRADVDTPADLEEVRGLDCGPATRAWPRALALPCGR